MWYSRKVSVPEFDSKKEHAFIRFNGAGYRLDVWMNGKWVGDHVGPYVKVDFDVTEFVKTGAENQLVVRVANTRYEQHWAYRGYAGLYAPVQLQIRPIEMAQSLRLAPKVEEQNLVFDFKPNGFSQAGEGMLTCEVSSWPEGKQKFNSETKVALHDGERFSGKIAMPNAQFWSPDHPALYVFALKWNGKEIAKERFGFREISIREGEKGQDIYLNGKRLYLKMLEFNDTVGGYLQGIEGKEEFCANEKGYARKLLMAMKYANLNCFRPHSEYAIIDQTFYNLCDEVGILIYLDWPHYDDLSNQGAKKMRDFQTLELTLPLFRETIEQYQNHPALGLVSFGNELYNFLLPKGNSYLPVIQKYYDALKEADLQKRPSTASAGGSILTETTPLDVVDTHHYIGVYAGCSIGADEYLKDTTKTILGRYQKNLALISSETGYVTDIRQHQNNFNVWAPLLKNPDFDRKAFAEKCRDIDNGQVAFALINGNAGGVRCYLTDFPEWRRRAGIRWVKRYFDIYRRNHQLTDGVSCNTNQDTIATYRLTDRAAGMEPERWKGITSPQLMLGDPFWDYRESFQDLLPIVTVETPHPISGQSFKGTLTVVNDTEDDVQGELTIQLRDRDDKIVFKQPPRPVQIKQGGESISALDIPLPENLKSGWHKLELYIHQGEKVLSSNHYDLSILSASDRITEFPSHKKIAIYDVSPQMQTTAILKKLGIEATPLKKLSTLSEFDVLILGVNSLDYDMRQEGDKIREWMTNGGRLLCLEQSKPGDLPWSHGTMIQRRGNVDFIEMLRPTHPVFKGFDSDMVWDNAPGGISSGNVSINESTLACGNVDKSSGESAFVESLVSDIRIGKGECLISMIDSKNFGIDGTVTRFLENTFKYILGDEISSYAATLNQGSAPMKIVAVKEENATFIDISKVVNRSFSDDAAGDGKGGWTDYGGEDMRDIPTGKTNLEGFIPFQIIDPAQNQDRSCLVLRGPTRESFPEKSDNIPVGKCFGSLYFLHTAMWVHKGDVSVVRYVIHYEDGTEAVYEPKNGIDISDWYEPQPLPAAQVAFIKNSRGVFSSAWKNPFPRKVIQSIRAESTGNAITVLIAITGESPDVNIVD